MIINLLVHNNALTQKIKNVYNNYMTSPNHTSINHILAPNNQHQQSRPVESEPFSPSKDTVEVHEVVEHEVQDKQVQPHIEVRKDVPEIPPDLKNLGVTTTATSSFSTYQSLKLPLNEEKLPVALKAPLSDSIRWLGELTQYLINQSHGAIKKAHKNFMENFIRLIGKDFGK